METASLKARIPAKQWRKLVSRERLSVERQNRSGVTYNLDRLGWLQFEQLCSLLLELEGGVAPGAWKGSADRCRCVLSGTSLAPPLLGYELHEPVLVQCAWLRPGAGQTISRAVERLAAEHSEDVAIANSYLLLSNASLEASLQVPVGDSRMRVGVLGAAEIGAQIDAVRQLRLAMPSLLGLGPLQHLIGEEVSRRSTLDAAASRDLAETFVATRAYRQALAALTDHRFAVLTGPPEMGKTAIARMIALAKQTAGWEAHECNSPDDVWHLFNARRHQVFIADDAFGSTEYRPDSAERWARAIERLLRALDDRHWLIWTSRPAPLHAALGRLHRERGAERFPAPARVLVDAGALDRAEKSLILFRHAKAAAFDADSRRTSPLRRRNRRQRHFTPERIRRLIARLWGGARDVRGAAATELHSPTEAMETSFAALESEHRDLLVALLDTPPGPVTERDLVAAVRRHHDGSLSRAPNQLVQRLADHFLRVRA